MFVLAFHVKVLKPLTPDGSIPFVVQFIPPKKGEADYLYENFQDEVIIYTQQSKVVVPLRAIW